jgi:hypothetical protein
MIFGGIVGAFLGMLYDPRATTYTVPTRRGVGYPGNRDDRRPSMVRATYRREAPPRISK